jgi:hypothetical protein
MINLTPEQLKNLDAFLARVELKGSEVNAFNNLVSAIFNPQPQTGMGTTAGGAVVGEVEEAKVEEVKDKE